MVRLYHMSIISGLILGLVEGFTEFIPVSSTGHLILVRSLLGLNIESGLAVDAVLNMSAVAAIVVYFFKDIVRIIRGTLSGDRKERTLLFALILGTIPAVIIGFLLQGTIETTFRSPLYVALGLVLGSILFILAERYGKQLGGLTAMKGIMIGVFQALALLPGMSRSGMSIVGGLFAGLTREEATRFAFLLSAPIIFGAGGKELFSLYKDGLLVAEPVALSVAVISAFLAGIVSISFMLKFLRTNSLMPFVWYRLALAGVIVVAVYI